MKTRNTLLATSVPALLLLAGASFALQGGMDEHGQGKASDAGAMKDDLMHGMQMPQPTKEHEWLKGRVGTWDAVVSCEMLGDPTTATETTTEFGDFWTVSKFEGSFMGEPFKGMSLATYDPMKQKYISTWCDTTMPALMIMEGTTDPSGKKLTSKGKGPNMEGQIVEYTSILETKSPDHAVFTMYETTKGPDNEMAMTIEYRRRK